MSARIYNDLTEPPRLYYAAFDLMFDGSERSTAPQLIIPRGAAVEVIHEQFVGDELIDVDIVYRNKSYTVAAPFLCKKPIGTIS